MLADTAARTREVRDTGTFHLLVCANEAQAALVAEGCTPRGLCSRVGQRHLAVASGNLPAFRKALLKLGYVLPAQR
ncbi:hypothetical protein [Streptomyces syringium]|uniref:hypothetical protein n=1 Tax=Streptomyces syringium TaxID=76729 RepID=UPI0033E5DF71